MYRAHALQGDTSAAVASLQAELAAATAAAAAAAREAEADKAKMTRALEELRRRAAKAQKALHAAEMQVGDDS